MQILDHFDVFVPPLPGVIMSSVDAALATQLANIEKRTGKSLKELEKFVKGSGLQKHGELRDLVKKELGLGHGDANTLVHYAQKTSSAFSEETKAAGADDILAAIYTGPKAALLPIHEKIMAAIHQFGEFEIAPKKTYLSLRRKKQFAMVGPATNSRIEVGLNFKGVAPTARLEAMPEKSMCPFKVKITDIKEVDAELIAWLRTAFDGAG